MKILRKKLKGYTFHYYEKESERFFSFFLNSLSKPTLKKNQVLGGRGYCTDNIPEIGSVVIKHFKRGGILGKFISKYYLGIKKRPVTEMKLLNIARNYDVNVPTPLACLTKGMFIYKGYMITKEIDHIGNLAQAAVSDPERVKVLLKEASRQIKILINQKVYHIDLHPGNIIYNSKNEVFFVDFDKARIYKGKKNDLRDLYICRWRRAVIKYKLPEILSEHLSSGLRSFYD